MPDRPPFRQRPNLHLALTHATGSPRAPYQNTPVSTPSGTPFATTSYSPFPSASLKTPAPYGPPMSFRPRRKSNSYYGRNKSLWFKQLLASKPAYLLLLIAALALWWFNGGKKELIVARTSAKDFGRELLRERRMHEYQFFPATNPKIHYIGRWSSTPNRLRKDGTFPGVYFDIVVNNTSSLVLALHNAAYSIPATPAKPSLETNTASSHVHLGHLSFRPTPSDQRAASPISLLAQVDDDEYILFPNSSSLVSVCPNNLDPNFEHHIRVIAPMTDDLGQDVIELEGLWLSKGGKLVMVPGSLLSEDFMDEDLLGAESSLVGENHRAKLHELDADGGDDETEDHVAAENDQGLVLANVERRKLVEFVTDSPGSYTSSQQGTRTGGADGLLRGVLGWEYLLGEMFRADHVGLSADGMCLIQDCIGGAGSPVGMGDVVFRSGPFGSSYFQQPWSFSSSIPDVLVLNLGASDQRSFDKFAVEYNRTLWDLHGRFESTYVSLVKALRRLAYPRHPAIIYSERVGVPGSVASNTPVAIPIFVMRPLRGELEQATQNVVAKLRGDGDKSVFWLDTSGWLDVAQDADEARDFFLDEDANHPRWRLTEQGNQRVAIFLHMHVCRFLAGAEEKCPFLPQEVYQGRVFDPDEASFDRLLEKEKERKLKKIFGDNIEDGATMSSDRIV